jgi:SAM-dependent methyltransferase
VTVRSAWESEAAGWVRWARDPALDHTFWRWNLPALLDLIPAPGELTVDVGCGEGRVARELSGRGHRVVGIEGSDALAAAAREADPDFEVHVADAAEIPLAEGSADLAVASMSLFNIERMPEAVREIARVLRPGGRLVFSIVHPSNSAKEMGGHPEAGSYFDEYAYAETREREDGSTMTFHDIHRPLEAYVAALRDAGLVIEDLREPRPPADYVAERPEMARWLRRPCFLHVRAVKPA